MRQERPDHTLQATSLVNEAYLRLIDVNRVEWHDRAHFLAVAAQMMRGSWWSSPATGNDRNAVAARFT